MAVKAGEHRFPQLFSGGSAARWPRFVVACGMLIDLGLFRQLLLVCPGPVLS